MDKYRILFLDDDEIRISKFLKETIDFYRVAVRTAKEAIEQLQKEPFDIVSLDHDLGGKVYTPSDENSGYEVAKYITTMETFPELIIIHTMNSVAGPKMYQLLKDSNKHRIVVRSVYGSDHYWGIFEQLRGQK